MSKLSKDGLLLSDSRGQSYDNAASMAGKYSRVQTRISQQNKYAKFSPCRAHCLNLTGVHAASVTPDMITFFGTVQHIFNYFSGSTGRWETLSNLKLSLKGHSDTRWSSKYQSVHALHLQIPEVLKVLHEISDNKFLHLNADTVSLSNSIIKLIDFKFISLLATWEKILMNIDRVHVILQEKTQSIEKAAKHIEGLYNYLQDFRDNGIDDCLKKARDLCEKVSISAVFPEKRKRKVKKFFDEKLEDEGACIPNNKSFKIEVYQALDTIISQIKWRFKTLPSLASDFNFLTGFYLCTTSIDDLQKAAVDLALKYTEDLDAHEISLEIESFKYQASSLLKDIEKADLITMLNFIHEYGLASSYPNIEISLRLALTLPITSASCERSFSKLKLVKTYLRSKIGQERLTNLAILSIE